MKTKFEILLCLLSTAALLLTGCSEPEYPLSKVSGKVTLDGEPLAGVEIVFSPKAKPDNCYPGPYSYAITDATGNYQLNTRYDEPGAVVGKHSVIIQYQDSEKLKDLQEALLEAIANHQNTNDLKLQIEALEESRKGRPMIPASSAEQLIEVVEGDLVKNFELANGDLGF